MIPVARVIADQQMVRVPQKHGGMKTLTATALLDCLAVVCEAVGRQVDVDHPALDYVMASEPGCDSLVDLVRELECQRREWRGR